MRVTLYSRVGCHLCTDARAIVAAVCAERAVVWDEVDVDSDPALRERYGDHVPVTVVDGRQLAIWFLEAEQLRTALGGPATRP